MNECHVKLSIVLLDSWQMTRLYDRKKQTETAGDIYKYSKTLSLVSQSQLSCPYTMQQ